MKFENANLFFDLVRLKISNLQSDKILKAKKQSMTRLKKTKPIMQKRVPDLLIVMFLVWLS